MADTNAVTADPRDAAQDSVLRAFADGQMSKERAIAALGLRDYAQLLIRPGEAGLQPPQLPAAEVAAMQGAFVRLLREARGTNALHADHP